MSLLTICQSVMSETGWPEPQAIAASTEATARQIFRIANTELRALSQMFEWPHLETEYDFATVPAQAIYFWPDDFRVAAQQSVYNKAEYYGLKGSIGIQQWHMLKYGNLSSLNTTRFRTVYPLGVPGIELTPVPVEAEDLVGVYYSKEYAKSSGGVSQPAYTVDTDVSKVPEEYVELGIKWRFRRAKGLDFSAELAEYNATVKDQFSRVLNGAEIKVGGPRWPYDEAGLTPGYVRDQGFGQ